METEIKLLKDREVDQKNQASGYETLLRDGIPLNEHFLALKNKFNNEQNDLKNEVKGKESEIESIINLNEDKKHKIGIMKKHYEEILSKFQENKKRQFKELEK